MSDAPFGRRPIFRATIAIGTCVAALTFLFNAIAILTGHVNQQGITPVPRVIVEFFDAIPYMALSLLFGAVGAYLRTLIRSQSQVDTADTITLGGWLGVIGYLCLESKPITRLFYDKINCDATEVHFIPLALVTIFLGFFAHKIIAASPFQSNAGFSRTDNGNRDETQRNTTSSLHGDAHTIRVGQRNVIPRISIISGVLWLVFQLPTLIFSVISDDLDARLGGNDHISTIIRSFSTYSPALFSIFILGFIGFGNRRKNRLLVICSIIAPVAIMSYISFSYLSTVVSTLSRIVLFLGPIYPLIEGAAFIGGGAALCSQDNLGVTGIFAGASQLAFGFTLFIDPLHPENLGFTFFIDPLHPEILFQYVYVLLGTLLLTYEARGIYQTGTYHKWR